MEQHPVPQDIKSFQFRLVGDMTLRQFAFLAGGAALAYVSFILPLPTYVKYPLVVVFAGGGAAAAFVPINGRPLDRWLAAFLRAIFGPTRRIWIKSPPSLEFLTQSYAAAGTTALPASSAEDRQRLEEYLASLPPQPESAVDKDERSRLKKIDFSIGGSSSAHPSDSAPKTADESRPSLAALAAPKKALQLRDISGQERVLPQLTGVRVRKLGSARAHGEINLRPVQPSAPAIPTPRRPQTPPQAQLPSSPTPAPAEPRELFAAQKEVTQKAQEEVAKEVKLESYQAEVKRLAAEKEILEEKIKEERQKAEQLRRQAAQRQSKPEPKTKTPSPPPKTPSPPPPSQPVKKLVLPTITDTPNVINGVVADRQGELLENAVVVIKDDDGTPVRALKTNKLGQFAISTPLRNGAYQIEVEKEGHTFEPIYQEVSGSVLPPLQIRSKE
jgi:hypothetical protein